MLFLSEQLLCKTDFVTHESSMFILFVNIIQSICEITGDPEEQGRMNCIRTSVGKPIANL